MNLKLMTLAVLASGFMLAQAQETTKKASEISVDEAPLAVGDQTKSTKTRAEVKAEAKAAQKAHEIKAGDAQ